MLSYTTCDRQKVNCLLENMPTRKLKKSNKTDTYSGIGTWQRYYIGFSGSYVNIIDGDGIPVPCLTKKSTHLNQGSVNSVDMGANYRPRIVGTWPSVIPPHRRWWPGIDSGIIRYSFTDLGRMAARGGREICRYGTRNRTGVACMVQWFTHYATVALSCRAMPAAHIMRKSMWGHWPERGLE